jgi:hypothetical protein
MKEFSLAFCARRVIFNVFAHWGNQTRVVGPVILHAPGDGAAAGRLADGLGALAPVVCALDHVSQFTKLDEKTPLVLFWSPRAALARMADRFVETARGHSGPVFVCLAYGEDAPEELADYRLIAPDIDSAEFNTALRAQQIFVRERLERDARQAELERRRARVRSGRAFAGGAVMGFATSVALVGALGAGAISAAGQMSGQPVLDTDPTRPAPPPGVPMIQPLAHDEEMPAWSAAQLESVSYAQQVAFVEQELARAEARMSAAPQPRVTPVETRFADASGDMWSPAPRIAPIAPLVQVAALDAKIEASQLLEIPDLAPDFWRIVAGPGDAAKVPSPAPVADFGADDGLWRPS